MVSNNPPTRPRPKNTFADPPTGQSYRLNADTVGDAPHWDDTARDTLHLANTFQEAMPPPIVAMGQSWGGYPVLRAALLHPRLFAAVVALEPWVGNGGSLRHSFPGDAAANMARRRDRWPGRAAAARALRATPYFAAFDADVFERVVWHDLRLVDPDDEGGPVTLVTPKAMEVATMMRAVPAPGDPDGGDFEGVDEQLVLPGFYRAEPVRMLDGVRDLRPPALFVFGTESPVARSMLRPFLLETVGTGELGSGGREKGLVDVAWVEGAGHPMPLEKPKGTADAMTPWIMRQVKRWEEQSVESRGREEFWVEILNPEWDKKISKL
jgi:pimeloyl-ACP methyl ester carboxylesterase